MARRRPSRAFSHRAGVRITGTHITCDAAGSATDLVFLSHAQAVGEPGRRRFPLRRAGRQELPATGPTLTLLGRAGRGPPPPAPPPPYSPPLAPRPFPGGPPPPGPPPPPPSPLCRGAPRRRAWPAPP